MLKRLFLVTIMIVFLMQSSVALAQDTGGTYLVLKHSWGGDGNAFNNPSDVEVSPDGDIFVVNRGLIRVTHIVPGEESYTNFGSFGAGDGLLINPNGIHILSDGSVIITGQGGISHFSHEGVFLRKIPGPVGDDNYLDDINDVVVGKDGKLYLSVNTQFLIATTPIRKYDTVFAIKVLDPEGNFLSQWNVVDGVALKEVFNLAIDAQDNLYLPDMGNNRLLKCKPDGTLLDVYDGSSSILGALNHPYGVALEDSGNIFIAETGGHRIRILDATFNDIGSWEVRNPIDNSTLQMRGINFDLDGNLIVLDAFASHVYLYDRNGNYIKSYGLPHNALGQFWNPYDVLVSKTGKVFVADGDNNRIQAFDLDGNFIDAWNVIDPAVAPNMYPFSLAEDSHGNLYVADNGNNRVTKFSQDGAFIKSWGAEGTSGAGFFWNPRVVVVRDVPVGAGRQELVYVSDNNSRIQVFNTDGVFQREIETTAPEPALNGIMAMEVDSAGTLYVLNREGNSLLRFDSQGNYIDSLDGKYTDLYAYALTIGPDGALYLLNAPFNRIFRIETSTMEITGFWEPNPLNQNTFFHSARGFSFLPDGTLYLADFGHNRILVFDLPGLTTQSGTPLGIQASEVQAATQIPNGGFEDGLAGQGWTYTGTYPASLTSISHAGANALALGSPTCAGDGYAQAYTTLKIPPNNHLPVLNFYYQVETSDVNYKSDLFVEVQDAVGINQLFEVTQSGDTNSSGNGTWKQGSLALPGYTGKTIRLSFMARCRFESSTGIVARIDDVSLSDVGFGIFMPIVTRH